ncbi:MAG: hypothetical protein AB7K24_07115 [Gemmataceae bacterium]
MSDEATPCSAATLARVSAESAEEVCSRFQLSELAQHLISHRHKKTPCVFLDELLDRALYVDAIDFLAHGLHARDAVWWGCLSARHVQGVKLDDQEGAALFTAGAWVIEQTGEARAQAKNAAKELGGHTPVGMIARAAAHAGKGDALAAALAVSAALKTLASADGAQPNETVLRKVLVIGLGIAEGEHSWDVRKKKKKKKNRHRA